MEKERIDGENAVKDSRVQCSAVHLCEVNGKFEVHLFGPDLIELSKDIVKGLSTDQKYFQKKL